MLPENLESRLEPGSHETARMPIVTSLYVPEMETFAATACHAGAIPAATASTELPRSNPVS